MTIVEKTDYTLVIMKDSEDPYYMSVHDVIFYNNKVVIVLSDRFITTSNYICTAGKLIAYFENKIPEELKVGDRIRMLNKKGFMYQ